MNNLINAIKLYSNDNKIKKLEMDYILSDNKQEKQALKISIINLKLQDKN